MVNTMFVLDRTLNTSHILSANKNSQSAFWEDTYTQEFDTGAESFEFSCYTHESIKEGNYVAFFYNNQYKMFQIIEVQEVHKKGRLVSECYCEIASLQLLNNYVKPFSGDMNCIQFFQHILHGTEWHIGKYSTSLENVVYTVNEKNIESVWSLIEDYKDIYGCEINVRVTYDNGHVTGQYIDIYAEGGLGSSTLKRFEYGRNVTGITKTKDLYDWCTGIILDVDCDVSNTVIEERDGYGFTKGAGDVILDDNANRMYNAGRTHVIGVYQGDETEPVEACINAWKELQKRKEPKFNYKVTTALKDDEYEDIHLGDTVYVVDHSYTPPLLLEARVGKLELSFTDRTQNSCTLTNYKEIKSKLLDADYIKLTGTITDIVNSFFPITNEGIADGAISDGKIDTVYYQQITADIVSAGIGAFENLYAQGLTVINADIEKLNATTADITELKAQVADIDTLINGHLTSDNIQSLILTSDKVTVADAFIKDAMIDSVIADKITSGSINTNNVYISSEDGSMIINGSLQQFKDENGNVRIQIGKDAQGDFTFSLFDENGTGVLINEKGITENAIADGLIVNDMVAENAGIAGSKLDIDSVVTEINEGTTTIKGSKVILDENNQTLDVAFNVLNTKVDDVEEEVTSNTTAINVQQGQIDSLISNTTITKENGEVVQLKDEYNSTKDTVDSHATKIGSLETTVNTVSSKQASMELDLNGFRTEVSNSYATKGELESLKSSANFIKNGKFKGATSKSYDMPAEWTSWGCEKRIYGTPYLEDGVVRIEIREEGVGGGIYQNVTGLPKNTTFTLSFKYHIEQNIQKPYCDISFLDNSDVKVGDSLAYYLDVAEPGDDTAKWKVITFTTPNVDFTKVRIGFGTNKGLKAGSNYSYLNFSIGLVQLELGTTQTPWKDYNDISTKEETNYNLINNGRFYGCTGQTTDIPYWVVWGNMYTYYNPLAYGAGHVCLHHYWSVYEELSGLYQIIEDIPKGTEVTLSYFLDWEDNVNGAWVDIIYWKDGEIVGDFYEIEKGKRQYISHTFTTINQDYDYFWVRLCINGLVDTNNTSNAIITRFGEVKLEKGNQKTPWSPSETDYTTYYTGDNLIVNGRFVGAKPTMSADDFLPWFIAGNAQVYHNEAYKGIDKSLALQMLAENSPGSIYQDIPDIPMNTELTLSFYCDWQENVIPPSCKIWYKFDGSWIEEGRFDISKGNNVHTFTTPNYEFDLLNLEFFSDGLVTGATGRDVNMYINKVKLEVGNVATPWVENINYIEHTYTTKTEFQQSNEDFTFKIQQTGGYNLIKNSTADGGTNGWVANTDNATYFMTTSKESNPKIAPNGNMFAYRNGSTTTERYSYSPRFTLKPNTTYTLSAWVQTQRNVKSLDIFVLGSESLEGTSSDQTSFDSKHIYHLIKGPDTGGTWQYVTQTFTTLDGIKSGHIRVDHNGLKTSTDSYVYIYWASLMLTEGSIALPWSPHPSEVYDGIVKIDKSGLTVQHANNKSVLDSEALKFYNGNQLYSKVDGGVFKVMNPGNSSSTVGTMGRTTWVNTGAYNTFMGAGLGHSVALGSVRASGEPITCALVDCSQGGRLTGGEWYYDQGLNITSASCYVLNFKGVRNVPLSEQVETSCGALSIWGARVDNNVEGNPAHVGRIFGRDSIEFGIAYGQLKVGMEMCETANASNNVALHMYGPLNMHGYTISRAGWSNPVSASSEYTSRLLREGSIENINYGTLSYYEGELRWCWKETVFTYAECDIDPATDEWVYTGRNICYVELPIFMAESIQNDYHINISKMSWGDYRIVEKNPYYFIIESQEEDFAFTFEVVAKLVDRETLNNNVSIASMSTTANPAVNVEPPTTEDIILPGSENIWESAVVEDVVEEVIDNLQENINMGEE